MAIDSRGGSTEAAGAARTTRNGDAARAVRSTRTRLHERRNTHPDFAREMLILHINAVLQGAAAMPVLVIVAAGLGIYFSGDYAAVLPWACLTLGGYLGLVLLAHRAQRVTFDRTATIIWARRFFLAHCAIGLCWTAFALSECESCAEPSFSFYKGVILLVALAATAMATFTLRHIVAASFAAPALIFAGNAAWFGESGFELAMALVVVTAFGYFIFLSDRLFRSNIKLLSFQSEKVALIAELEIAKAMSDEARLRAEEANLAKSRFLASMSHELRTPLNAILGFSEVMSGEVLGPLSNPTYKDYAGDIHRSGEHLLNLINEILDLSRIEAGRYELNEGSVSLAETALGCIGMIDLKARSKSITLEHRFERAMPQVWADERAMRQVILNLLSNAVKFTPASGHVTVKVGWTAGGGQYVSVRDDGPGIPENEIPIVLSAFGQGSVAIKGAEQGTGLGLPIVKAILDKHGGTLILRSRPGEGTQAIAILPAERVLQSIQPAAEPQAEEPASERRVMA